MRSVLREGKWRRLALAIVVACLWLPVAARAATIDAAEIASMQSLSGISCTSASTCYGIGIDQDGNPALISFTNGSPGAVTEFPDDTFQPLGLACAAGGKCVVVGNDVDQTSGNQDGAVVTIVNGTPGSTQETTSAASFQAVGCAAFSYCVAAGQDPSGNPGTSEITGGQPQSLVDISDQNFQPEAVGCPSASKCVVAGIDGLPAGNVGGVSVVTGGTPAAVQDSAATTGLDAVGCWSTGDCAAGGTAADGTDSAGNPIAVPSVTAVGNGALGASWDYDAYQEGGTTSVACASATTCLSIGDDDNGDDFSAPIVNGAAGAAATLNLGPTIGEIQFTGLACPSTTSCLAVGQDASANPVIANVPVPAYHTQSPTSPGGTGSPPTGVGGPPSPSHHKSSKPRRRTLTRLLIAVTWPGPQPVRHLDIAVRCQDTADRVGIEGLRVRLEDRPAGSHGRWRVADSALTRRVGRVRGEARFRVPARPGPGTEYRAEFSATSRYAGSVSAPKTIVLVP